MHDLVLRGADAIRAEKGRLQEGLEFLPLARDRQHLDREARIDRLTSPQAGIVAAPQLHV